VLRFTAMCRYLQREEKRRAVDRGRVSERRAMCDDGDDGDDYKAREGETGSLLFGSRFTQTRDERASETPLAGDSARLTRGGDEEDVRRFTPTQRRS
jgi:hypothetical protein